MIDKASAQSRHSQVTSGAEFLSERTIADFGEQWQHFRDNKGAYGSTALLADVFGPLLSLDDLRSRHVAEIGSGSGRIVNMLIAAGAERVFAVEPSSAYSVLMENVAVHGSRVQCAKIRGDQLPHNDEFDFVFSIGVLHHIPQPAPVVRAAYKALKAGGHIVIWLYGREGNGAYLAVTSPLRALTTRLPHRVVNVLSRVLTSLLLPYVALCRHAPLPLRGYLLSVFQHMPRDKQVLIVYDQLRPTYAKYYSREEARALLTEAGFRDVRLHHRHGYSWTVIGTKPA